jgi:virginiamycin B lyase
LVLGLLIAAVCGLGWLGLATPTAQAAPVGAITEFSAGLPSGSAPSVIASGTDNRLWFVDGTALDRIAPDGTVTTVPLPPGVIPTALSGGPFGNMWVLDRGTPSILQVAPNGTVSQFTAGLNPGSRPTAIEVDALGTMWFTDRGTTPAIGTIGTGLAQPTGTITEHTTGLNPGSVPESIARGPDGAMWVTDAGSTPAVARITTSVAPGPGVGTITEAPLPSIGGCTSTPRAIVQGPAGNMWFTDTGCNTIWQVTGDGQFNPFGLPSNADPIAVTLGPLGNLWYADDGANNGGVGGIGRFDPGTGTVTSVTAGFNPGTSPVDLTTGSDGNVWFADAGTTPAIGRVGAGAPGPVLLPPLIFGSDQAGAPQICSGERWATWDGEQPTYFGEVGDVSSFAWMLDGFPVPGARARTYIPGASAVGHQLTCSVTVGYLLSDVEVTTSSPTVTVLAQSGGPTGGKGTTGSRGGTGKAGSGAKVRLLSCGATRKLVQGKWRTRELCTVKLITTTKAFALIGPWTATVSRSGRLYAKGIARFSGSRLNVIQTSPRAKITPATYTLRLQQGRRHTRQLLWIR